MRLYMIYKICKKNISALEFCKISTILRDNELVLTVRGWTGAKEAIERLYSIEAFKYITQKIYESVPVIYRNSDSWEQASKGTTFESDMVDLIKEMRGVIHVYESLGYQEGDLGIDIKMPKGDFSDFVSDVKSLEYIFTQCPLLKAEDGEIKFNSVDVGSTWLTFLVVGAGALVLAKNVAALIDKALILKSHFETTKQQEELLRTSKTKNDILDMAAQTFKTLHETTMNQILDELEGEEVQFNNPEERDKTKVALEKMVNLLDKGMEIYASIDSPKEIQVLFPPLESERLLTDNITKFLPTDKDEK